MIPKVIYQTWKSKILTNKMQEVDDTTICLNMIVKNESNIIIRLFDSILPIIDSYCICDTGSTDNTIEIIKKYFDKHVIKGKYKRNIHTTQSDDEHEGDSTNTNASKRGTSQTEQQH